MRGILKWGGISVLSLLLLAITLLAIGLAINARDESLSPQAQSLLIRPANPYPPEDNIYLALAGFDAPPGESVTTVGQSRVEEYNSRLAVARHDPHWESLYTPLTKEHPGALQFKGSGEFLQSPRKSYWSDAPPHRAEIAQLLADNAELMQRYHDLHRRHGFYETATPNPLEPIFAPPSNVRTLFLAELVLRMRSADARQQHAALADLEDDLRLWRAVLTGEGTLISKMLAIAYLHWDELVLADMIADPQAPVPDAEANALALLFAPADWNIGRVFFSEFRLQAAMLQQMQFLSEAAPRRPVEGCAGHRWLCSVNDQIGKRFFKINATENLYAMRAARLAREAAPGSMRDHLTESDEPLVSLRSVYNPFGRVLVGVGAPLYRTYTWRAWDGAAFQRLVRLGYEIRRQRIAAGAIAAFLTQHPELATHPGDGRPFLWEAAAAELRVQTMAQEHGNRSFSIHVWQGPAGESTPALAPPAAPR